jgi:hypothetical protein
MSNQSILTNVNNATSAPATALLDLDVFCINATDTLSLAVCTLSQALTASIMNQTTTTPTAPSDAEMESSSLDIAMFVLLAVRWLHISSQAR